MRHMVNVILTRDPKEMLPSFAKVISNPKMDDVGYKAHMELVDYFQQNNIPFVVMDGRKTLLDPEGVLNQLCDFACIELDSKMLSWEPQKRPEDGVWAKYWYANVHKSEGFSKYQPKTDPFPNYLKPLLHECERYYSQLSAMALG